MCVLTSLKLHEHELFTKREQSSTLFRSKNFSLFRFFFEYASRKYTESKYKIDSLAHSRESVFIYLRVHSMPTEVSL